MTVKNHRTIPNSPNVKNRKPKVLTAEEMFEKGKIGTLLESHRHLKKLTTTTVPTSPSGAD